ncbi:hypothetical protein K461DRAFT_90924 [Myriangium duriaei CBS 260.36]|uniref:Uncharacterized protein n=1 Tax=Myriangium duriaei CBS 260.36 TaxID=1168546 RepID=A0A9P4J9Y4_9PEZI|nr:hypothetical protein K461DRAFT_90924 [Myriangium duriaei CBS 260.36]
MFRARLTTASGRPLARPGRAKSINPSNRGGVDNRTEWHLGVWDDQRHRASPGITLAGFSQASQNTQTCKQAPLAAGGAKKQKREGGRRKLCADVMMRRAPGRGMMTDAHADAAEGGKGPWGGRAKRLDGTVTALTSCHGTRQAPCTFQMTVKGKRRCRPLFAQRWRILHQRRSAVQKSPLVRGGGEGVLVICLCVQTPSRFPFPSPPMWQLVLRMRMGTGSPGTLGCLCTSSFFAFRRGSRSSRRIVSPRKKCLHTSISPSRVPVTATSFQHHSPRYRYLSDPCRVALDIRRRDAERWHEHHEPLQAMAWHVHGQRTRCLALWERSVNQTTGRPHGTVRK